MRLLLGGWGCRVETAAGSGDLFRHDADQAPPDLILADYHLDGETGLDLIVALRRRWGAAVPAVLITADRSAEVRARADELDVAVAGKPVKPATLRAHLTRIRRMAAAAE
jgi:CheY-like chemotaxis protein